MIGALLSTLPGDIPGLLRRGSPVLATSSANAEWTITDPPTAHDLVWLGMPGARGVREARTSDLALDLTDPTGRAHAAWWTFQQRDPPEGWTGFPPPISVEESMVRHCAIMGADMSPEQIDTLARLVLRLAGRTP